MWKILQSMELDERNRKAHKVNRLVPGLEYHFEVGLLGNRASRGAMVLNRTVYKHFPNTALLQRADLTGLNARYRGRGK